jgi:hypothetical protein
MPVIELTLKELTNVLYRQDLPPGLQMKVNLCSTRLLHILTEVS